MPFYEYECGSCKFCTEVLQKISDKPLRKCPSCGANTFKRLISAPVFRLKGSGWYETDFKSDKESKRNLVGADKDAPAAPKDDAKAESKPDAKADAKTETKSEAKADGKADAKGADKPAAKPAARAKRKAPPRRAAPARKK